MKPKNVILIVLAVTVVVALFIANRSSEQPAAPAPVATATEPQPAPVSAPAPTLVRQQPDVPPYYPSAEAAMPFPKTVPSTLFPHPVVARAYAVAERIPGVLAQQPCYCWCDKFGHGSLLDCYKTDHGAGWAICVKEVLLADRMTKAGKTPSQIREAIIRGDFQNEPLQ